MSTDVDSSTPEDANITFTEVETQSLFTSFVIHSPEDGLAQFSPYSAFH